MKKTKIAINTCWGGFGLSPFAIVEHYKLTTKVSDIFLYIRKKEYFPTLYETEYVLTDIKDVDRDVYDFCICEKYQGDVVLFKDLKGTMNWDISKYLHNHRDDEDLITVIEKYGEKCNRSTSCLEIYDVVIPEGCDYDIYEYDGYEEVVIEKF